MNVNKEVVDVEQAEHDYRWECREIERRKLSESPEAGADKKAQAALLASNNDSLSKFEPPTAPATFGKLVYHSEADLPYVDAGQSVYIGKQNIFSPDKDLVVVDWRSPAARPFHLIEFSRASGVQSKQSFEFNGLKLIDIEEVVAQDLLNQLEILERGGLLDNEIGVDGLLKDLERTRDGTMRDIVRTIQTAQFELISADLNQVLIIQGGPGTGKTAIALHRVSWILFNHPEIKPESIVVIGPNRTFLRYIGQVLPDLGDKNVRVAELNGLLAQGPLIIGGSDSNACASLKGSLKMEELLRRALRNRLRSPDENLELVLLGRRFRLESTEVDSYLSSVVYTTYSQGRDDFRRWLVEKVAAGLTCSEDEARPLIDRYLERCWPMQNARTFVYELLASQDRLLQAAEGDFLAQDILDLKKEPAARVSDQVWTVSDVALVDYADLLINGRPQVRFQYIVVDEAQDLSAMQLQMLKRRSINGAMTLVGDIAQSTGPHAPSSWSATIDALSGRVPVSLQSLKYGYRVPREVHEFAADLLPGIAPGIDPPIAVRGVGSTPVLIQTDSEGLVNRAIRQVQEYAASGRSVGLICADAEIDVFAESLNIAGVRFTDSRFGSLGSSINLVASSGAKGLEFEAVVVAEPEAISGSGPDGNKLLYIALTRTTRDLSVIYVTSPLPGIQAQVDSGPAVNRSPTHDLQAGLPVLDGAFADRLVEQATLEISGLLSTLDKSLQLAVIAKLSGMLGLSQAPTKSPLRQIVSTDSVDVFSRPSDISDSVRQTLNSRDPGLLISFPRAYSSWSTEEDEHLTSLVLKGMTVPDISRALSRQEGAIRSRMQKLGFTI